ncbi:Peptidyl-prolyl cis-trans isomerase fkbp12 [Irineochytrium annulatum]|nr:Peptidyl-prolyl cis-trans isomerase fkbp12 [Irineochytrium annulatum]
MSTFTKEVLQAGNGPRPQPRQQVTVRADLYLAAGMKGIWSTHEPSGFLFNADGGPKPFTYQAGVGSVVKGWEDGVASMQLGEKAKLTIPWQYAYGENGNPAFKIPGKSDLVFIITVLQIQ